jgi:hypothetical protein
MTSGHRGKCAIEIVGGSTFLVKACYVHLNDYCVIWLMADQRNNS